MAQVCAYHGEQNLWLTKDQMDALNEQMQTYYAEIQFWCHAYPNWVYVYESEQTHFAPPQESSEVPKPTVEDIHKTPGYSPVEDIEDVFFISLTFCRLNFLDV